MSSRQRYGGFMDNKRSLGTDKEKMAAEFLEAKGYIVLKANYRTRAWEIDLICKDGETYVFVEVKYRADKRQGHPLEAVTPAKQRKIRKGALFFLAERNLSPDLTDIRFDVVGILGEEFFHIENAF